MKTRLKAIIPYILVLLLLGSNLYFILRPRENPIDYQITFARIGTRTVAGSPEEYFVHSEPLTDKDELDIVIFSLMHGKTVEAPEAVKTPADTSIWITAAQSGIVCIQAKLWLCDGKIIYCLNDDDQPVYRVLDTPYYAEKLTKLAQKYSPTGTYSD